MSDVLAVPSGWTDARVDLAKRLWLSGLSSSEIARQLGGVSRNAVIGKLTRIGLADKDRGRARQTSAHLNGKPVKAAPPPKTPPIRRPPATVPPPPIAIKPPIGAVSGRALIAVTAYGAPCGLADRTGCKWIFRETGAEALFCNAATGDGETWCEQHHAIAYDPRRQSARSTRDLKRLMLRAA